MRKILGKVISCFTICMIILSTFSITSFAATAAYISLSTSSKTIEVGDQITVTVKYDASEAIYSVSGSLSYNASVLQYVSGGSSNQSGSVKIVESSSGDSVVSYAITFKAVAEGNSYLDFSMYGVNSNLQKTTVASASVAITVNGGYYTYTVSNGEATITGCDSSISGDVTIPSTLGGYPVTSIDRYAFVEHNFISIIIPDSVTSIGEGAFSLCTDLTSITIPDSVTSIGGYAFEGCSSLTSVTIPDSVTSIGDMAFGNCNGLISIEIPNSITHIGNDVFYDCNSLTSVTIPDSVTSIGDAAFYECSNLTSITIPDSVTGIGNNAFQGCTNLTIYTNKLSAAYYYAVENSIPYKITGYPKNGTIGDSGINWECSEDIGMLTISGSGIMPNFSSNYMDIPWGYYKDKIISVNISGNITAIGANAFSQMSALKSIDIPNSVYSIGEGAFSGCVSLESVSIPSVVDEIKTKTFYNCRKLKNIDLSNVYAVNNYAFYRCSALENVKLNNIFYVGDFSFNKCTSLKTVSFGANLSSINESAFWGCTVLESVSIPQAVDYIDETAFENCENASLNYFVLGDVSGDGKIDATDLVEMKKLLLLGGDNLASDINADGVINILDFICLNKNLIQTSVDFEGAWSFETTSSENAYIYTLSSNGLSCGIGDPLSKMSEEDQNGFREYCAEDIKVINGEEYYFGRGNGWEITCTDNDGEYVTFKCDELSEGTQPFTFTMQYLDESTLKIISCSIENELYGITVGAVFVKQ